jgi:uncharacterized Zn finger protein
MNPNTHEFEALTAETPKEWDRFEVGEVVTIKNTKLVIESIGTRELRLRPWRVDDDIAQALGVKPAESYRERLERRIRERTAEAKAKDDE